MLKRILVKTAVLASLLGIVVYAQGSGTPSNLRVLTDANNYLLVSAAAQTNPISNPTVFTNTRLRTDASGSLVVVLTGSVTPSFPIPIPASTCAAPSLSLSGAATTGIAFTATPSILNCIAGTAVTTLTGTSFTSTVPVLLPDGLASAPSLTFATQTNKGLFSDTSNQIAMSLEGVKRYVWGANFFDIRHDAAVLRLGGSSDVILARDAANTLALRNGTNAQRYNVYNTYTSAISNELFSIDWQTTSNVALIGTRTTATGTGRPLRLIAQTTNGGNAYATINLDATAAPFVRIGRYNSTLGSTTNTFTGPALILAEFISVNTSGDRSIVAITPTYNQASGTAANTDLLINRTQTAVGSGAQLLLDAQVGGVSQFSVRNDGVVIADGNAGDSDTCAAGVDAITVTNGIVTAITCTP